MARKSAALWQDERALTAFQVDPVWYEKYWFGPEKHSRGLASKLHVNARWPVLPRKVHRDAGLLLVTMALLSTLAYSATTVSEPKLQIVTSRYVDWIAAKKGWKAVPAQVRIIDENQLAKMFFGDSGTYEGRHPLALYSFRDHNIYASNSIDLASVRDKSILLHEIVHHLQISNVIKFPCRSAYDAQAYRLQIEWLKEQGVPNVYTITVKEWQIEDLEECPTDSD